MNNRSHFVIKWSFHGYVPKSLSGSYVGSVDDPQAKTWKTHKNAERWLNLQDPSFASVCEVVEIPGLFR